MTDASTDRPIVAHALYAVFVLLFLASRLAFLDADVPEYGVTGYSPVDEFYYNQMAFELIEPTPTLLEFDIQQDLEARSFAQTYLTAASLALAGDNYYGVRLPSVLAGLIVFFFWLRLAFSRFGFAAATILGLLLLTEFGFILSNRVAEPTIIRLAATSLVLWYILRKGVERPGIAVLGFISSVAWLFVYPTNAFLMPAGFLAALALSCGGEYKRAVGRYTIGALIGAVLFAAVLLASFSWAALVEGFNYGLGLYGNRVADAQTIAGIAVPFFVYNVYLFISASYFRTSLYLEILTALTLAVAAAVVLREMRRGGFGVARSLWAGARIEDKVVAIYFLCFFAQALVINDYPYRKLSFAYPFILYGILLAFRVIARMFGARRVAVWRLGLAALVPVIATVAATSWEVIYSRPTFEYRNAMQSLRPLAGQYVLGGLSTVFRGYNDYRTYLKPYMYTNDSTRKAMYEGHLASAARLNRAVYVIDYYSAESEAYYRASGYEKIRTVMGIHDPTNVNAEVALLSNGWGGRLRDAAAPRADTAPRR